MTGRVAAPLRVVGIADADSHVKWAAATIAAMPGVSRHLLIVRTPLTVSARQQQAALTGSGFAPEDATRIGYRAVARWLRADQSDVVVVSGRGPFIRLVMRVIDTLRVRPVVVTGFPGITIPATRGAVQYRRESDLVIVHSLRERRAFAELGAQLGVPLALGLATLPFARRTEPVPGGTDLVFAAQALVPHEFTDRRRVAGILRSAAEADPSRRVVVKLRSRSGEAETHRERSSYEELLRGAPENLVIRHVPMREALQSAEGLVTISSTAAIEAIAHGVPVIALDEFGISKPLLNTVFRGSGLLAGADAVIARDVRTPEPEWLRDNYFHDEESCDAGERLASLVERRRAGQLAPRTMPRPRGGALHVAWQRKSVLAEKDRTVSGAIAYGIGAPLTAALAALRRRRPASGAGTWTDAESDLTLTPSPLRDSIRR